MRRMLVSPQMSQSLGRLLSREGVVRLLTGLHDLPRQYDRFRRLRTPEDESLFLYFDAVADGGQMHTFTFLIDDSTSPDHLIVTTYEHRSRPF
ncbi:MAG: hypothetical protein U0736_22660 [Gemmataceae bacterium]